LKAFVSAPFEPRINVIRFVLEEMNVELTDAYSFAAGDDVQQSVVDRIQAADLVLVVLTHDSVSQAVFEAGIALGANKPVAVITDGSAHLPLSLAGVVQVRTTLQDSKLLRSFLSRFISDVRKGRGKAKRPRDSQVKKARPSESALDQLANRLRILRSQQDARGLEQAVLEIFSTLPILQVSANELEQKSDRGVDAVLWSDPLTPTLGNPILVEVKGGRVTDDRLRQVRVQLERYLKESDARTALFIYLDPSNTRLSPNAFDGPHIIPIDAEDLVGELKKKSFEEVLLAIRNEIVHGKGR
jgi:hypothetical protein